MDNVHMCDYGCGKPAVHQFKNGKRCCKRSWVSCTGFQKQRMFLMDKKRRLQPRKILDFSHIDSETKAYLLGLFYTDGNICFRKNSNRKTFSLALHSQDLELLTKIGLLLDRSVCIYRYRKMGEIKSDDVILIEQLLKKGIVPRKTYEHLVTTCYDCVPKDLKRHFIRGLIDGDGSIMLRNDKRQGWITSIRLFNSNQKLLKIVSNHLYEKCNLSFEAKVLPSHKNSICNRFSFGGINDVKKIIDYLYKDSTIYLERKKKISDEILSKVFLGKTIEDRENDLYQIIKEKGPVDNKTIHKLYPEVNYDYLTRLITGLLENERIKSLTPKTYVTYHIKNWNYIPPKKRSENIIYELLKKYGPLTKEEICKFHPVKFSYLKELTRNLRRKKIIKSTITKNYAIYYTKETNHDTTKTCCEVT